MAINTFGEETVKRLLLLSIALFVLVRVAGASAEPVISIDLRLKDLRSDGFFRTDLTMRSYDTGGGKGPVMKTFKLLFPRVVKFRPKGFPTCSVKKLERERDAKVCKKAMWGSGTAKADVRPLFPDLIDAKITLFLGKRSKAPNAVMNIVIFAEPISDVPLISNSKLIFEATIFKDNSDPRFGSRMDVDVAVDTGIPGLTVSVAEMKTTVKQLFRRNCLKKRRGKCVRRSKKKIGLFKLGKCPKSKKVVFRGEFTLLDGTLLTHEGEIPCRFKFTR